MTTKPMTCSIVIPVFNAESTLQELCTQLVEQLAPLGQSFEVILIDDCSLDNSWNIMRQLAAGGGIQISASHNPIQYNGLKLFDADGRVIPAGPGREVLDRYRNAAVDWVSHDLLGTDSEVADTTSAHLQAVLDTVDVERIRRRTFNVLLDSNRGAGSILGRLLLKELGLRRRVGIMTRAVARCNDMARSIEIGFATTDWLATTREEGEGWHAWTEGPGAGDPGGWCCLVAAVGERAVAGLLPG